MVSADSVNIPEVAPPVSSVKRRIRNLACQNHEVSVGEPRLIALTCKNTPVVASVA
jgi:hypothetical protein